MSRKPKPARVDWPALVCGQEYDVDGTPLPLLWWSDVVARAPYGTRVAGMAPIGMPWGCTVRNGSAYADGRLPLREFCPISVIFDGVRYAINRRR